ncbi:hypothetical protein M378DRAFT_158083 [Amanita muscaria Koide BX008]|uniref:Conidiation-specific protein 6 n=1 Tax=Amanita muscaria (strain Koide BX008) TaxID=946122 RepID=A0A0C2XIX5_AMAMK|nr:hypothetical protein M378DRAFT_158083 [Amanita muscaria Koide BX008]
MSANDSKNPNRVAGGYKATLNNPNTSDEAKHSARDRLDEMQPELENRQERIDADSTAGKNPGNVIGGHKANLKNPQTSEEAKEHSRHVLDNIDDGLADGEYVPEQDN